MKHMYLILLTNMNQKSGKNEDEHDMVQFV